MEHLYVIGNGFDLHHHIPSGYSDFHNWLEKNMPELYNQLIEFFPQSNLDKWWSDFEKNLASLDAFSIAYNKTIENIPNVTSDNFSESEWYAAENAVERQINEFYDNLTCAFRNWVQSLPQGNIQKKIKIHSAAVFLNFNYTNTLEEIYKIKPNNILHIHGNAKKRHEQLVFGHGTNLKSLSKRIGKVYIDSSTTDYIFQRARDSSIIEIHKRRKKIEKLIKENSSWFKTLCSIKHVYIYGFSFSVIDLPYIYEMLRHIDNKNTIFEISAYRSEDRRRIRNVMKRMGITNYSIIKLTPIVEVEI